MIEALKCERKLDPRYKRGPVLGGRLLKFKYTIDGEKYVSSSSYLKYEDKVEIGQTYYVEVPKDFRFFGKILLDHPSPDSVISPTSGWNTKTFEKLNSQIKLPLNLINESR